MTVGADENLHVVYFAMLSHCYGPFGGFCGRALRNRYCTEQRDEIHANLVIGDNYQISVIAIFIKL